MLHARKLQQHAREIILNVVGKHTDGRNGLLKQSGHTRTYGLQRPFGSLVARIWLRSAYGFPTAMAMAAAIKGKGSDTAARNQTNFAGMNGISHSTSRWNANSAQATT